VGGWGASSFFVEKFFLFCTLFSLTPGGLSSVNAQKISEKISEKSLTGRDLSPSL
jgi:hypothetical protein